MSNNNMSELDLQAARNLKSIWLTFKKENKINQTDFAEGLGWSQGNFSQYLTGSIPIGLATLVKLANSLECNASDIREEIKDKYFDIIG